MSPDGSAPLTLPNLSYASPFGWLSAAGGAMVRNT